MADRTPERQILDLKSTDRLGEAIIALTRELSVIMDRQLVLEAVLQRHGIDTDAVETFQPDEALSARIEDKRQAMLDSVLFALTAG